MTPICAVDTETTSLRPDEATRHTALGDAAWALAIYDHITTGGEKAE